MLGKDRLKPYLDQELPAGKLVALGDVGTDRDPNLNGREVVVSGGDEVERQNDPGLLDDEEGGKLPPERALEELLTTLGDDTKEAKCIVWRIGESDSEDAWLYEATVKDFMVRGGVSDVARRYGPGLYRIRVYRLGKIFTHKRVKIGGALIPDPLTPTPGGGENVALLALVQAMKESNDRIITAIANKPAGPSLSDYIKDLAALQGLTPKPAEREREESPLKRIKETADLIAAIQSLNRGVGGGARVPDNSPWSAMLNHFLPVILEKVKELPAARVEPPPAAGVAAPVEMPAPLASPASAAVVAAESAPPLETVAAQSPGDIEMLKAMRFKAALAFLVNAAERNLPVATYADMALDQVPPEELRAMLSRDDWANALAVYDPRVNQHPAWFRTLRDEILAGVAEIAAEAAASANAVAIHGASADNPAE